MASTTLPTVYERLATLADTAGRFIAGTVEQAFPEDASLKHGMQVYIARAAWSGAAGALSSST